MTNAEQTAALNAAVALDKEHADDTTETAAPEPSPSPAAPSDSGTAKTALALIAALGKLYKPNNMTDDELEKHADDIQPALDKWLPAARNQPDLSVEATAGLSLGRFARRIFKDKTKAELLVMCADTVEQAAAPEPSPEPPRRASVGLSYGRQV